MQARGRHQGDDPAHRVEADPAEAAVPVDGGEGGDGLGVGAEDMEGGAERPLDRGDGSVHGGCASGMDQRAGRRKPPARSIARRGQIPALLPALLPSPRPLLRIDRTAPEPPDPMRARREVRNPTRCGQGVRRRAKGRTSSRAWTWLAASERESVYGFVRRAPGPQTVRRGESDGGPARRHPAKAAGRPTPRPTRPGSDASRTGAAAGPFHGGRLAAGHRCPSPFLGMRRSRASVSGAAPIRPNPRVRPREPIPRRETALAPPGRRLQSARRLGRFDASPGRLRTRRTRPDSRALAPREGRMTTTRNSP